MPEQTKPPPVINSVDGSRPNSQFRTAMGPGDALMAVLRGIAILLAIITALWFSYRAVWWTFAQIFGRLYHALLNALGF